MAVHKDIYLGPLRFYTKKMRAGSTAEFISCNPYPDTKVNLKVNSNASGVMINIVRPFTSQLDQSVELDLPEKAILDGNEMNIVDPQLGTPAELTSRGKIFTTIYRYDGPKIMLANAATVAKFSVGN